MPDDSYNITVAGEPKGLPMAESQMPRKTREMHNHHFDSTAWNDFAFRDDDVIVATYGKSGTTWMQQIVGQLIFGGNEDVNLAEMSPWLDLRIPPTPVKHGLLEAQSHRRFVKTHLPVDALVFSAKAKYIYIGRDGRDVVWSFYNHLATANDDFFEAINETPGRVGPALDRIDIDVVPFFRRWLAEDGYPMWPIWENVKSWCAIRDLPNVKLVHFNDLKRDREGGMREIADCLEIALPEDRWPVVTEYCSFDYMKAHAEKSAPLGGIMWKGGAKDFINKGTNGRWRELLTADDLAAYEARAEAELGKDCARWLAHGFG